MTMNWDDLRVFLAVARASSLSAAAVALGVNQSTVSRRLAAMEADLDTRLIERRADGPLLTPAGTELLATATNIEAEVARADRWLAGRNSLLTGRLRITCSDNFLEAFLAPRVAAFAEMHPDIDLDIVTSYQHLSLARREADIAIRTTTTPPETLVGRRLFRFALAVYGARTHYAGAGPPPDPASLTWIGWESEGFNRIMIHDHFPAANVRHRTDSLVAQRALARAGLGVAVIGCFAADPDPDLVRIYPGPITENAMELWILTHPDIRRTARVRAFMRFAADAFLAERELFEGRRPA